MNVSDRVLKLEGLLSRVQKNAAAPRLARSEPVGVSVTPEPVLAAAPEALPTPAPPSDDAVPIPLVAVAPVARAPEELATVEVAAEAAALGVRIPSEYPEELTEDDLVEINSQPPPAAEAARTAPPPPEPPPVDDIDFDDEDEEQPPASSKRPKVPTSMDEALAAAAEQLDAADEPMTLLVKRSDSPLHDIPLKTPPPESGPQEAVPLPAGLSPARLPEVDDILEAELPQARGPRPEQLGQTIDLDEARGPDLELDLARQQPTPPPMIQSSDLEASLPPREAQGSYDSDLSPPPEAREDLQAFARPVAAGAEIARIVPAASEFRPKSFLELLDASIALGKA